MHDILSITDNSNYTTKTGKQIPFKQLNINVIVAPQTYDNFQFSTLQLLYPKIGSCTLKNNTFEVQKKSAYFFCSERGFGRLNEKFSTFKFKIPKIQKLRTV